MNKYGFKKGDLLRWTDYVQDKSVVGLFLEMRPEPNMNLAGVYVGNTDVKIYWDGKGTYTEYSKTLEVISESR